MDDLIRPFLFKYSKPRLRLLEYLPNSSSREKHHDTAYPHHWRRGLHWPGTTRPPSRFFIRHPSHHRRPRYTPVPEAYSNRITALGADLTDASVVNKLITSQPFTTVYLFHGIMSSGSEADLDLGLKVNVDSVRCVLDTLRNKLTGVKVVFSSTSAVYGPEKGPVTEQTMPQPLSSYGTEKFMTELLINDFSRRGLIDGRIVRLPTVVVRPGKPSAAASSFASGIVRESLQGIQNTLPVPRSTPIWICSPATVVKNLIMMKDIPAEKFGNSRIVNLPGRTVSVQDILDAVEKVGGKEALGYVKEEADEAAYKIVKGWAPWFDDSRAMSLGLHADGELVDAVKAFQDRLKAK
ncbi:hypothetical protein NXS19_008527 [Fusarium pseudograminearum]|nr:hypothetical protein NXS19_008527 [Fusarium pseudograminearum]